MLEKWLINLHVEQIMQPLNILWEISDKVSGMERRWQKKPWLCRLEFHQKRMGVIEKRCVIIHKRIPSKRNSTKWNHSIFLGVDPKEEWSSTLSRYRPICLIGSLSKRRSKILAARLKLVLDSPCRTAFIPGWQILDGVVVTNDLIDLINKRWDKCMFLKVDFEKNIWFC